MAFDITWQGLKEVLMRAPFHGVKHKALLHRSMDRASVYALGELQKRIPVDTGQSRGRMTSRVTDDATGLRGEVGGKSISESGFNILRGLEEGTGLYGPFKQRIYPTNAKVLRWTSRSYRSGGAGGGARVQTSVHFAKSTAGMTPRRPFARTKAEASGRIQKVFVAAYRAGLASKS